MFLLGESVQPQILPSPEQCLCCRDAHAYVEQGHARGKVILRI